MPCPSRNKRILGWSAAAILSAASAAVADEPKTGNLTGDYFVGASVFLFARTVLTAFAPAGTSDAALDAGAIVLANETGGNENGAVALEAISGWLAAETTPDRQSEVPGFSRERERGLICLLFGADADAHAALARRAGFDPAAQSDCAARYGEARRKWRGWLQPFRKGTGAASQGGPLLRLSFAPTVDDADQAIADAMQKNGLFQLLTDDFNARLTMPRPITALLTQCGEPKVFYNADRGEAVVCYELLAALVENAPR
jgi:hypothetical protein